MSIISMSLTFSGSMIYTRFECDCTCIQIMMIIRSFHLATLVYQTKVESDRFGFLQQPKSLNPSTNNIHINFLVLFS